jgi:lysophospholipase L1-like esterase
MSRRRLLTSIGFATAGGAATAFTSPSDTPEPTPEPRRILIMGSSTTAGVGPVTATGAPDPARSYVNLTRTARPEDTFTVLGRGGTYVAYGTNPATNWTQTTIPAGHDTVIIQLGINDWYVPVDPTVYRAQLDELLGRVATANPAARTNGAIHWIRTWMPTPTGNADIRRSMWVRHGYTTADAIEHIDGHFHDMPGTPTPYAADTTGWHYNATGHQKLADTVLTLL